MDQHFGWQLDLETLEVLHVLLRTRSVTGTAQALRMSQPAVSRALARLRDRLNDPLFIRASGNMVPTAFASSLSEPLQRWLDDAHRLFQGPQFDPASAERTFRIAASDHALLGVIRPIMRLLHTEAPGVRLMLVPLTKDSETEIALGHIDLILTGAAPNPAMLYKEHAFHDAAACIVRRDHPLLSSGKQPDIAALRRWPELVVIQGDDADNALLPRLGFGATPPMLRTSHLMTVPFLIEASDAFALLPARIARRFARSHALHAFAVPAAHPGFDCWIAWHERTRHDVASRWLIDRLAAAFRQAQGERHGTESLAGSATIGEGGAYPVNTARQLAAHGE